LRRAFPQPVSAPEHDAYFVFSILKALDKVDALKSSAPMLGRPVSPDWEAAARARMSLPGLSLEDVIPRLVEHLEGMFIWGHPRSQINVVCPPTIASIIGVMLPSTYNPNLVSEESSRKVAQAEVEVCAMTADLIGYDPAHARGVFTFGGTGAMLYGAKVGLEKAIPGCMQHGLREDALIVASTQSHYAALNVAGWLGIGQQQVRKVTTHADNAINLRALEETLREILSRGQRIAAIIATMGTTDAFGLDNLEKIYHLRNQLVEEFELDYRPHIHADAVIGWAWSVFNDYDFGRNELGFRGRTVRALAKAQHRLRHLHLADSIGVDFHKTGFAPYISSLVLFKQGDDFKLIERSRESMPYLYQSGRYHPGQYTLETSRSGCGPLSALANLLQFGKEGLRVLLGHVVEMSEVLRERLEAHPCLSVMNRENVGPVTLFRAYPDTIDTFSVTEREQSDADYRDKLHVHNLYNRAVFEIVNAEALEGRGVVISLTDCYRKNDFGDPIVALKSYILSPFSDQDQVEDVIHRVQAARETLQDRAT